MKLIIRLTVSLLIAAALVAYGFSYLQVQKERERLHEEFRLQAQMLAQALREPLHETLGPVDRAKLERLLASFGSEEGLPWLSVYDSSGNLLARSADFPRLASFSKAETRFVFGAAQRGSDFLKENDHLYYVYSVILGDIGSFRGTLVILRDASHLEGQLRSIWNYNFLRLLILSVLIIAITFVVVRWNITGPLAKLAGWTRRMRLGKEEQLERQLIPDIFEPLAGEVRLLARSFAQARTRAEEEARLRASRESVWTAERLREHVRKELAEKSLMLVSNRQPYAHMREGSKTRCIVPAGGLVTALDPVMRACGGVWIAHGSGTADREHADASGRLMVPPDEPVYTLRRVWLSKEEEQGYYYGFANEGLWPLCHNTHTRPTFRLEDWQYYQQVNQKFAEAVSEEIGRQTEAVVLVHDYHFALLPRLLKACRPDARIGIFWHIPWPNPEAFGICPWKEHLLDGLLGADLVGFQTQFHCNNFLETVDRFLESKIDWDQFSVERRAEATWVKPFPISVAFPNPLADKIAIPQGRPQKCEQLLKEAGVHGELIAVGVDRIDYTKGILERCRAVERLLEKHPEYVGRFTFVELAAPSRTHIKRYHDLIGEIEEVIEKVNWRFHSRDWRPIVFLKAHHSHEVVHQWYAAAHVCLVTALHDGMNLVAKEFVSARDDEDGVLVLSQFTGASRELREALIVNPYDTEGVADAIHAALQMPRAERIERMARLRETVRERNVYRWAANLVTTLARLRLPKVQESESTRMS